MLPEKFLTQRTRPAADLVQQAIDLLQPDAARLARGRERIAAVWRWQEEDELPILLSGLREPPATDDHYPYLIYDHAEQFYDRDKMLFEAVWALLAGQNCADARGDAQLGLRANFGVVIVPSAFDVPYQVFAHTLPWVTEHLSKEQIIRAIARHDPTHAAERGLAAVALERALYFRDRLGGKANITTSHNQSPLDIAHLIRDDALFTDMYDDPAFAHDLLETCTQAYISVGRAFQEELGCGATACDDSATLLGPAQFLEFALPYTRRALEAFGGGSVHFCGDGKHILEGYLAAPEVKSVNLGQPELYDPQELMPRLIAARKVYSGKWPVHPGESLEAYCRRILGALGSRRIGLILSLGGYEFGLPPEQVAECWYEAQRTYFRTR